MEMKTSVAFVGSLVGLIAVVVSGILLKVFSDQGQSWGIFIAVVAGVTIVLYIVGGIDPLSSFGAFCRGCMIGLNAGDNAVLIMALLSPLTGTAAGAIIGAVLGLLVWLSVFDVISRSDIYKGFLGWLNILLPASWPIIGLGLVFLIGDVLGYLLIGLIFKVDFFRINDVNVGGATGTWLLKGGMIGNMNIYKTAFNMGNFIFVHKDSASTHQDHESGHALNLGAFGSVFHLIGWFDEFLPGIGRGASAFAERLADSNDTSSSNGIPIWNP
jgi:hypothetical protein